MFLCSHFYANASILIFREVFTENDQAPWAAGAVSGLVLPLPLTCLKYFLFSWLHADW